MIEITVVSADAGSNKPAVESASEIIAEHLKIADKHVEIFLVGDAQMQKNVLAFPAQEEFPRPDLENPSLGEIHLNPTYIKRHNEDLMLMLAHGFLHLLGYDHESHHDRIRMEQKERELLRHIAKSV